MKKNRWAILLTLVLAFSLTGCSIDWNKLAYENVFELNHDDRETLSAEEIIRQRREAEQEAITHNPVDDLDEAFTIILEQCSGEFIGNHPIDETFLLWMYAKYGEQIIEEIATAVKNEYNDSTVWYHLTGNSIQVLWLLYCRDSGFQPEALDGVYWCETASPDEVVLDFTGDVNFTDGLGNMRHLRESAGGIEDCFSDDLLLEMRSADICMINNEFTYSKRGEPLQGKPFTFRADPSTVGMLDDLGVDIVGIANNHVYDYGPDALIDTVDTLDAAGMPHVGAGKNLDEAMKPVYFVLNGRKFGIVAATQIERSLNYTKEATADSPGVLKTLDPTKFVKVIADTKKNADMVFVFVHWGTEGNSSYGSDQAELARKFVDAGADAIIGGHTHCLQGITYIGNVPVIYSLGNYWFSSTPTDGQRAKETGIAQVRVDYEGMINFRFLPCEMANWETTLLTDPSGASRVIAYEESLSNGVTIDQDGYVSKK